jgi:hypothetical protein
MPAWLVQATEPKTDRAVAVDEQGIPPGIRLIEYQCSPHPASQSSTTTT